MMTILSVFGFVFGVFCFILPLPLSVSLPGSVCAAEAKLAELGLLNEAHLVLIH